MMPAVTQSRANDGGMLSLLRNAGLFSTLSESELGFIARYSRYRDFRADQTVFEEGGHVEELYLIKEGAVLIRKKSEDGTQQDIARFIGGEVFGEMDLLDASPRSASAIAESDSTLLVFPGGGLLFPDILARHPDVFAHILQKLLGVIAGRIRATDRLISENVPWVSELKKQLLRDKLTSLHNKAFLDQELGEILEVHPATGMLAVKPDNFKTVNDTYGHDAGDAALALIADTLKSTLKGKDIGVRYRGDEFCVVLPGKSEAEAARAARGRLDALKGIDLSGVTRGNRLTITASIGVSAHPAETGDPARLVALALERMLEARALGGDRVNGGGDS
jgi:diguanylate cyclase (GGDEF)-like protein